MLIGYRGVVIICSIVRNGYSMYGIIVSLALNRNIIFYQYYYHYYCYY